jgi:hypothetical protein
MPGVGVGPHRNKELPVPNWVVAHEDSEGGAMHGAGVRPHRNEALGKRLLTLKGGR